MPWTCPRCVVEVELDVVACLGCGEPKQSWTVHGDVTRNLAVAVRARFKVLRGSGEDDAPAGDDVRLAEWTKATHAPVLSLEAARRLAAQGRRPATAHLLRAWVEPRSGQDAAITLGLDFSRAEL